MAEDSPEAGACAAYGKYTPAFHTEGSEGRGSVSGIGRKSSSISSGATTVAAPKSVGSMTTKGQMKPASWRGGFNGIRRQQPTMLSSQVPHRNLRRRLHREDGYPARGRSARLRGVRASALRPGTTPPSQCGPAARWSLRVLRADSDLCTVPRDPFDPAWLRAAGALCGAAAARPAHAMRRYSSVAATGAVAPPGLGPRQRSARAQAPAAASGSGRDLHEPRGLGGGLMGGRHR